jgi:uncharacterized phage protein gp47/JayE
MPRFTPKRYEQILAQNIARVVARSRLSDVSDTSSVKNILAASARQDDEQYFQMQNQLTLFSIDSASGDDLDERAKDIQPAIIQRRQATQATGNVVFSRAGTTGTVNIPTGTKVKTSSGVVFTTTAPGQITPTSPEQIPGHGVGRDSGLVPVIADVPGSSGRVAANTVIKFESKPAGVEEVTNPSAFDIGGLDKETDDEFRNRLKTFIAGLARCNVSAIEAGLIGQQDPVTNASILFSKVFEDIVNRGNITVYVDDGTGTAESTDSEEGTTIVANLTWNGTTTITTGDTSEVTVGDFIGYRGDNQLFEIASIVPSTSITILNPGTLAIPTGSGASQSYKNPENVTHGLAGPPPNSAVGGEERLFLDNKPLKSILTYRIVSSTRGILTEGVAADYILNDATGQINFITPLVAGERIYAEYTYYTGLIAFAQKIVDGDPTDRENYPGLRAGGVYALVQTPQVLLQNIEVTITVLEGYDQDEVKANVRQAIKDYINNLTISGDLILAELTRRIMSIAGVYNRIIITPANDIIMLDDQLARTQDPNIIIN